MALRFTADGAVGAPTSLQIRVGPGHEGRIRLDVPPPARALSVGEVLANARHFRSPGPRAAPIQHVVLSGLPRGWTDAILGEIVDELRELGIERIVVHLDETQGRAGIGGAAGCDLVVTSANPGALTGVAFRPALTIPLVPDVLGRLGRVMTEVERLAPTRVTWVWPFPDGTSERPISSQSLAVSLADHLGRWRDAPFAWGIKGLPRCALGALEGVVSLAERIWRTRNRYYVDADHQRGNALMFEPDLVQLVKYDRCRFCAVDDRCDGLAERWLAEGLVPEPIPLEKR